MHHSLPMSRLAIGILVFSLIGGRALCQTRAAEQALPAPRVEMAQTRGNQIVVPINTSLRFQMRAVDRDKRPKVIARVFNPKDSVAVVQPVQDDPRSVLITGREAGITRVTLTATDNTEESYEVIVEFDLDFLRSLLVRAVPTANVQLIAGTAGTVIVAGTVAHAEDIDIIMRTAQSVATQPDRVINALRVGGVEQVQLDCVVAFVSRSELRRMSFDFLNTGLHHNFSSTVGGALINPATGSALPSVPGIALPITNVIGAPNGAPANFFLGLFNDKQLFFGLLQALRNEGLAKILAEPRLTTLSGRSANLLSGGQQAIPESAGLGSISVRFEPFGTQLAVLPIVLGNGRIRLEVEPEVSNIDPSVGTTIGGTTVPGRSTQRVHTTVEMEDGQTLAIGGLIQSTITASTVKVPVLGDLPFLGAAFSSKSYSQSEQELVVLVTPHVVDAMSCDQLPKHLPGQETRSPDDFELFLEGIMEAPRGSREVFPNQHYLPAFKNGPTAGVYPCGLNEGGCGDRCGTAGCGTGGCGSPTETVTGTPKLAGAPTLSPETAMKETRPNTLPTESADSGK